MNIVKNTETTLYRKTERHELWGHYNKNNITLQLSFYEANGRSRIFENTLPEVLQGSQTITSKEIFSILTCVPELNIKVDRAKTLVRLEKIPKMDGMRNDGSLELILNEKESGVKLDNFMMIAMFEDKLKTVSVEGKRAEDSTISNPSVNWDEPEPIIHKTSKYRFKASYSPK